VPTVISYSFTITRIIVGGIERDKLDWVFLCDDGNEYRGTQDCTPATWAEHDAFVRGQAIAFTIATTQPEIVIESGVLGG
jgi:hypothetical protein